MVAQGVRIGARIVVACDSGVRKAGSTQFDYSRHISAPFERAPGSYMTVFDVNAGSGWHPVFGQESSQETKPTTIAKKKNRK